MEDTILSIPVMKKSALLPVFKLYGPIVHFCHRLHLLSSFRKKDKVYSVVIFMALNIRQPGPVVPGGSSPVTSQLTASGDFPDHRAGRGKVGVWISSPQQGKGAGSPRRPWGRTFSAKNKGEHKALNVSSLPSKTGQCDVQPLWRNDWRMGKEPPRRTRKNGPQGKPRRIPVPNRSERESCPEHLEGICLKRRTKLVLNTIPVPLTKA